MKDWKEYELTVPQVNLLSSMKNGWLLRWSNEVSDKRCWLESENMKFTVHVPTVWKLEELGIIKQDNKVPIGTFYFIE